MSVLERNAPKMVSIVRELEQDCADLRAEVERLRAALEEIRGQESPTVIHEMGKEALDATASGRSDK